MANNSQCSPFKTLWHCTWHYVGCFPSAISGFIPSSTLGAMSTLFPGVTHDAIHSYIDKPMISAILDVILEAILGVISDAIMKANWDDNWDDHRNNSRDANQEANWDDNRYAN